MIAPELLRQRILYDEASGTMRWVHPKSNAVKVGQRCGNHTRRYVHIKIDGKLYAAHRVAWAMHHGEWPPAEIDHIDGDCHNNRISNLRLATRQENNWNVGKRKDNKSGFKGVSLRENGKYRAKISAANRVHHLGVFDTAEEAAEVYDLAANLLHGEFACPGTRLAEQA